MSDLPFIMWYSNLYFRQVCVPGRTDHCSWQKTLPPSVHQVSDAGMHVSTSSSCLVLRLTSACCNEKYSNSVSCLEMTWRPDLCTSTRGTTFVTGVTRWSSLTRCMLVWLVTCITCNTCDTDLRPGGGDGDPGGEEEEGGGGEARQGAGGEGQEG